MIRDHDEPQGHASVGGQRLDKWLWFARVVKSRTLAAGLVTSGKVRVNRQKVDKPAHALKPLDVVTVSVGRKVRVLKVIAPGVRRGSASEAQRLFEELTPLSQSPSPGTDGIKISEATTAPCGVSPVGFEAGAGRPTKRDRRLIDRFHGRR